MFQALQSPPWSHLPSPHQAPWPMLDQSEPPRARWGQLQVHLPTAAPPAPQDLTGIRTLGSVDLRWLQVLASGPSHLTQVTWDGAPQVLRTWSRPLDVMELDLMDTIVQPRLLEVHYQTSLVASTSREVKARWIQPLASPRRICCQQLPSYNLCQIILIFCSLHPPAWLQVCQIQFTPLEVQDLYLDLMDLHLLDPGSEAI